MKRTETMNTLRRYWWIAGLAIAALVVIVLAPLASKDPDGLDSVAIAQGFDEAGQEPPIQIIPDYTVPGIDGQLSTILAGLIGVAIVFVAMWALGKVLARRRGGAN